MDKEDARFQTLEQLHERRKQVVRLNRPDFCYVSYLTDCRHWGIQATDVHILRPGKSSDEFSAIAAASRPIQGDRASRRPAP